MGMMNVVVIMMATFTLSWSRFSVAQLSPTGVISALYSGETGTILYYPANRTLYALDVSYYYIKMVPQATTLSIDPYLGPTWKAYKFIGSGRAGLPKDNETFPWEMEFGTLSGMVRWEDDSYYSSSFPTTTTATTGTPSSSGGASQRPWLGIIVSDSFNNAIYFINFRRGFNVTTVAGHLNRWPTGSTDGIGWNASMNGPSGVTMAPFTSSLVFSEAPLTMPPVTTVFFWLEGNNRCVRQGVPLNNRTQQLFTSTDISSLLQHMVLNVTSFAGVCGFVGFGFFATGGLVFQRPAFSMPSAVALVDPFPYVDSYEASMMNAATSSDIEGVSRRSSTTIMFVADVMSRSNAIGMIAPIWPPTSRFLSVISAGEAFYDITVGPLRRWKPIVVSSSASPTAVTTPTTAPTTGTTSSSGSAVAAYVSSVELYIGQGMNSINLSILLQLSVNSSSQPENSSLFTISVISNTTTIFTVEHSLFTRHVVMVPYGYTNTTSTNSTLVVLSGNTNGDACRYYCCLGPEYSAPSDWGSFPTNLRTGTDTATMGRSSRSLQATNSLSRRTASNTATAARVSTSYRPLSLNNEVSNDGHRSRTPPKATWCSVAIAITHRRRSVGVHNRTLTLRYTLARWGRTGASASNRSWTSSSLPVQSLAAGGATATAGIAVGAVVPGAASKAAVAGRLAAVWQCDSVGPAQVVANDPQQFLSFGVALGGDDDVGTAIGALVVTSCVRLTLFLALLIVSKVVFQGTPAPAAIGVFVSVVIGYFTPNVVGLSTSVLTGGSSGSSPPGLLAAAVAALLMEAMMMAVIAAGVWRRGGPAVRAVSSDFIEPLRRWRKIWYRVATLEDVTAAMLIAVLSNVPRTTETLCRGLAWVLLAACVLHLLYVVVLRPFRKMVDTVVSVLLAAFALLCCVVPPNADGQDIVAVGLMVVTAAFYVSLAIGVGATVWDILRKAHHKGAAETTN